MDALTEEFVDKIPEELSDVKDEMRTIGVQGVQGMIDGLYSQTGSPGRCSAAGGKSSNRSYADGGRYACPSKKQRISSASLWVRAL